MAVRLKFGNDLNISGSSRGAGGFISTPPAGGGGGFPAYGTVLSTAYGIDYDYGDNVYSTYLATFVLTQTCDVNTVADGFGGSFIDWSNATNVQYKPYGTVIQDRHSTDYFDDTANDIAMPDGNNYHTGWWTGSEEIHDGSGNAIIIAYGAFTYYTSGTPIYGYNDGSAYGFTINGNFVNNGKYDQKEYRHNGSGGYYDVTLATNQGSFITAGTEVDIAFRFIFNIQTEVPTGSSMYFDNGLLDNLSYYHDGFGGNYTSTWTTPSGAYYSNGTFIYNDTINDYYWDGMGGYYI